MPARSLPTSEYHQLALVSFLNSATPTLGLSDAKSAVATNIKVTAKSLFIMIIPFTSVFVFERTRFA